MKRRRGRGEEEEEANREGPRGDRHWRRSNNGLLTMIIEHEAAGTLLKSTENRAGGFTCRINFYLVPSLLSPTRPSPPTPPFPPFLHLRADRGQPVFLVIGCFSCLPSSSAFLPRGSHEALPRFNRLPPGALRSIEHYP